MIRPILLVLLFVIPCAGCSSPHYKAARQELDHLYKEAAWLLSPDQIGLVGITRHPASDDMIVWLGWMGHGLYRESKSFETYPTIETIDMGITLTEAATGNEWIPTHEQIILLQNEFFSTEHLREPRMLMFFDSLDIPGEERIVLHLFPVVFRSPDGAFDLYGKVFTATWDPTWLLDNQSVITKLVNDRGFQIDRIKCTRTYPPKAAHSYVFHSTTTTH